MEEVEIYIEKAQQIDKDLSREDTIFSLVEIFESLDVGLYHDVLNSINNLFLLTNFFKNRQYLEKEQNKTKYHFVRQLPTYWQYMIPTWGHDEAMKKHKKYSNPVAIKVFNEFVKKYNSELKEMVENEDLERLQIYRNIFLWIIYGKVDKLY